MKTALKIILKLTILLCLVMCFVAFIREELTELIYWGTLLIFNGMYDIHTDGRDK